MSTPDQVAADLTQISELYLQLVVEAIYKARAKVDGSSLPGGEAMVALAPVASPEDNRRRVELAETQHLWTCARLDHTRCWTGSEHEDEDEPALQTLLFWSEQWREELGHPLDGRRPTMRTESEFIRQFLGWAYDNELHWEDFAADIRKARRKLEALVKAGEQVNKTQVPCPRCERLLVKVYQWDESADRYACSECEMRLTSDEFEGIKTAALSAETGAFVSIPEAAAGTGRTEIAVRNWVAKGMVESELRSGNRFIKWADAWQVHSASRARKVTGYGGNVLD